MPDDPKTIWDDTAEVLAGMRVAVRAAVFTVEQSPRGAVTLTLAVPDGFYSPRRDGGLTATALMNPAEARRLAQSLVTAAEVADNASPPLYIE